MSILDDEEDILKKLDEKALVDAAKTWYRNHSDSDQDLIFERTGEYVVDYAFTDYYDPYAHRKRLIAISKAEIIYMNGKVYIFPSTDHFPLFLKDAENIPDYIIIKTDYILRVDENGQQVGEFQKFRRE